MAEKRLEKAICALQVAYLLTPRLLGSVMADMRQIDAHDRGASCSAVLGVSLSQQLERHLNEIMGLEAHTMRFLLHLESLRHAEKAAEQREEKGE
jgi:hypothetical protein